MKTPPFPPDEALRLAALRTYGILDTAPEAAFDELTALAASMCGTPVALISLIDTERQWFKARVGFAACETSRKLSFCAHALQQTELFIVPDTARDPRFADNPLVTADPSIRFYAGAPLITPAGHALGTLCVIDRVPRELTDPQQQALRVLSSQVITLLEMRRATALARADRVPPAASRPARFILPAFVSALLLLIGIGVIQVRTMLQERALAAERTQVRHLLVEMKILFSAMQDAETSQLGFQLTGDESYLEPYLAGRTAIDASLAKIEAAGTRFRPTRFNLARVRLLITAKLAMIAEIIAARREHGLEGALVVIKNGRDKKIMNDFRQEMAQQETHVSHLLDERIRDFDANNERALWLLVAGGLLSSTVLIFSFGWLRRESSLRRQSAAALLQANADLTAEIGERERAQTTLATALGWQQAILNSADVSIIATDPHGLILTFNAAAERMLGYRAEEVVGLTTWEIFHDPLEVQAHAAELTRALGRVIEPGFETFVARPRAGGPEEREWTYIRKDGRRFPVRLTVTSMLAAAGRITGFMGIATDLTERKQEEEKFHAVVEAAPNGIVVIDPAGAITLVNAQVAKLFGYPREELLGQNIELLVPERFRGAHPAQRGTFFAAPQTRTMGAERDWFGRRKDGNEFPVEIGLNSITTRAGMHVLATVVDVTERKNAEALLLRTNQELRVATEQAQAADRIKSAFLATMSHELRTPLNSIIGFTGIMLQGLTGPLNPEQHKQLEMVRGSSRHLLALINDVLDISKIEAGQLEIHPAAFDLAAAVAKVAALVQPLADKKGLALHVLLAPTLGPLVSDQRRVEQVLLNLLSNAIKFTEKGAVTLTTKLVGAENENPPSRLAIAVADTGMGIKPEDLAALFLPFRQIDAGLSRNHEGTGLGLAICRRLAQLMGGEMSVASEWGHGSTFTLTLPCKP